MRFRKVTDLDSFVFTRFQYRTIVVKFRCVPRGHLHCLKYGITYVRNVKLLTAALLFQCLRHTI